VTVFCVESLELPSDGNVSGFTVEQLQQLMQQLRIPASTLSEWNRLKVDGRTFAEMSDDQLAKYNVDLPLVTYFRDRSRLNVLSRLWPLITDCSSEIPHFWQYYIHALFLILWVITVFDRADARNRYCGFDCLSISLSVCYLICDITLTKPTYDHAVFIAP